MKARQILADAANTLKDREDDYDDYHNMLSLISEYWSTYLSSRSDGDDVYISESDVATMMSLFKIARSSVGNNNKTADDLLDSIGYLAMASDMRGEEEDADDLTPEDETRKLFVSDVRFENPPNWIGTEDSFENLVRSAIKDSDGNYEAGIDVKW